MRTWRSCASSMRSCKPSNLLSLFIQPYNCINKQRSLYIGFEEFGYKLLFFFISFFLSCLCFFFVYKPFDFLKMKSCKNGVKCAKTEHYGPFQVICDDLGEYPLTFDRDGRESENCQLYAPAPRLPYQTHAVNIHSYSQKKAKHCREWVTHWTSLGN